MKTNTRPQTQPEVGILPVPWPAAIWAKASPDYPAATQGDKEAIQRVVAFCDQWQEALQQHRQANIAQMRQPGGDLAPVSMRADKKDKSKAKG